MKKALLMLLAALLCVCVFGGVASADGFWNNGLFMYRAKLDVPPEATQCPDGYSIPASGSNSWMKEGEYYYSNGNYIQNWRCTCSHGDSHLALQLINGHYYHEQGGVNVPPVPGKDCLTQGTIGYYYCYAHESEGCNVIFDKYNHVLSSIAGGPYGPHSMTHYLAVAATCTTNGNVEYWYCSVCKKYFSDAAGTTQITSVVVRSPGHQLVEVTGTPATCTENGIRDYYKCSVCQKLFSDSEGKNELETVALDRLGHDLKKVDAVAATCTENGVKEHYECKRCKKLFSDSEGKIELKDVTIVALDHEWGDWTTVTPATCTEKGVEKRVCKRDNTHEETRETLSTDPDNHKLTHFDAVAATCTTGGNLEYWQCQREGCGKLFSDKDGTTETTLQAVTIGKLGHNFVRTYPNVKYLKAAATCTTPAVYYKSCSRCGASSKGTNEEATFESGEPKGHDFKDVPFTPEDDELHSRLCKNCGNSLEGGKESGKHVAGDWACQDQDVHVKKCTVCDHPMATEEHTYGAGVVTEMPTCWSKGKVMYTCTECGFWYTEELPALGHYFETVTIESTCTGEGYTAQKCIRCGLIVSQGVLDPAGHKPGDWEVTKPATCTENGQEVKYCTVCGVVVEMRDIDALGHDWGEWETVKEPTTEAEGEEQRVCKRDASHVETRPIAKLEPTPTPAPTETPVPSEEPTVEPTAEPTVEPTAEPTVKPTAESTVKPTDSGESGSTDIPKTGDNSRTGYVYLMMALAAAGLYALAVTRRKESDN